MTEFELFERLFGELNDIDCLVRILKFNSEKRQQMIKCISVRRFLSLFNVFILKQNSYLLISN